MNCQDLFSLKKKNVVCAVMIGALMVNYCIYLKYLNKQCKPRADIIFTCLHNFLSDLHCLAFLQQFLNASSGSNSGIKR